MEREDIENSPTISVVMPTHNRPAGLKEALDSITKQTQLPYEIVVVDDGSTPPVKKDIFKNLESSVKCTLIVNDSPRGGNYARNIGIKHASGEYIAFLDDDDQFKIKKIEAVYQAIVQSPDSDVFYHPAHVHMVNEGVSYYSKPSDTDSLFRALLTHNCIGGTPMVIAKRSTLMEVGLFDEKMPALQDYELWLRLAKDNKKFFLIKEPLTDYNYHTKKGSISKSLEKNAQAISIIEEKFSSYYKMLTPDETKEFNIWKKKMIIHKSLLNGNVLGAISSQFNLFLFSPTLVNFILIFIIFLGPKAVFKLKSKVS